MKSTIAPTLSLMICLPAVIFAQAQTPQAQNDPAIQAARARPMSVFPHDRLVGAATTSLTKMLPGNVSPRVKPQLDNGAVPADYPMTRLVLHLERTPEQQAALDAFSAALQDPSSPLFHKWITPQEFGEHFGLSQNDLDKIADWLKTKGFTVNEIPSSHWSIVFSGTAAQVEAAFQTPIHYYAVNGGTYVANGVEPQVPAAFADVISGIAGLNNFPATPNAQPLSPNLLGGGGFHFMDPTDFAAIYNVNPLYAKNLDGTGVNIAVIGNCTVDVTAVASAYYTLEGIRTESFPVANVGTPAACTSVTDLGEVYLDVEWAQSVAQGAKVWRVAAEGANSLFSAVQNVVEHNLTGNVPASVITMSYSTACNSQAAIQPWINIWQEAQTAGITVLVSSGDWGAAGCDSGSQTATHGFGINDFCQSIYVTCVGGTQFNEAAADWSLTGHALGYMPEVAWNEISVTSPVFGSTGGGFSTFTPKPSWQTGNGNSNRGVPDIALSAANHDGYHTCSTIPCSGGIQYSLGTSASAPAFAGIVALLVQQSGNQGSLNPNMYALAARSDGAVVFHDVTSGNNSVTGQTGYTAGTGWDAVTGLGSVDASALVSNWANAGNTGVPLVGGPQLTSASPSSATAGSGAITIDIYGSNFMANSMVLWNGTTIPTTFTDATHLKATVTARLLASAGTAAVTVSANGQTTTPVAFTIFHAASPSYFTYYFPQLAVGSGFETILTYVNYSQQAVNCQTAFYADSGVSLKLPFTDTAGNIDNSRTDSLAAGASLHIQTAGNTPAGGWAQVQCSGAIKASLLYHYTSSTGSGEAGVNAVTVPATEFVTFAQTSTGIAYANPSSTTAKITLTALNSTGLVLGSTLVTLQPHEHGASNIYDWLVDSAKHIINFTGSVQITSTAPIVSLALNNETFPVFSSLPAGDLPDGTALSSTSGGVASSGATTYYFPQLAFGGSFQTILTYVNYSQQAVSCTSSFFSDAGSPLSIPFTDATNGGTTRTDNLAAGASLHIQTTGNTPGGGWAQVQCGAPIKASLLYHYTSSTGSGEAGVNAVTVPATKFVTFAQASTGIAYANTSSSTAKITLTALDSTGLVLGSTLVTLQPHEHGASNIYDWLVDSAKHIINFTGSVQITSTAPIVSLALNNETFPVFSSLPAGDLPDGTALGGH